MRRNLAFLSLVISILAIIAGAALVFGLGGGDDGMAMGGASSSIRAGDASVSGTDLHLASIFEGGKLYRAGRFNVLVLNGTYREMGRQYGGLIGPEMKEAHGKILSLTSNVTSFVEKMGMKDPGLSLQNFSSLYRQTYPGRFQEMIEGMSETSGMSAAEISALNEFFSYHAWRISNPAAQPYGYCSAITAWGNYTGGGPLVMGRDFDFSFGYRDLDRYLTVTVFNPADGSNSAATIAYAGMVGAIQCFNEAGLVLENNDGSSSGDVNRPIDRGSFLVRDVQYMFDYSTLAGMDAAMKSRRNFYPLIYSIADPSEAYVYETTTSDVKRRGGSDGLLACTNHFLIKDWEREGVIINSSEDSISRYRNLTDLAQEHKGHINSTVMREIMDAPREDGGAATLEGIAFMGAVSETVYQFVAVPGEKKIWIKAPKFENWTEVDLGRLFE